MKNDVSVITYYDTALRYCLRVGEVSGEDTEGVGRDIKGPLVDVSDPCPGPANINTVIIMCMTIRSKCLSHLSACFCYVY